MFVYACIHVQVCMYTYVGGRPRVRGPRACRGRMRKEKEGLGGRDMGDVLDRYVRYRYVCVFDR